MKQSGAGRAELIKKLRRLDLAGNWNVEEYFVAVDRLFSKLKGAGCKIPKEKKESFVVVSLSESYDGFLQGSTDRTGYK